MARADEYCLKIWVTYVPAHNKANSTEALFNEQADPSMIGCPTGSACIPLLGDPFEPKFPSPKNFLYYSSYNEWMINPAFQSQPLKEIEIIAPGPFPQMMWNTKKGDEKFHLIN